MNREEKIEKVLLELGVPHHFKGYEFIKQSIVMITKDKSYKDGITKKLYPDLASVNGTKANRVERAIRHAIDRAFQNTDAEILTKYFGNSIAVLKGKATNKQFLITLADYILNNQI